MVAAGAVVEAGTTIPAGQIWGGNPARFLRELKPEESRFLTGAAGRGLGGEPTAEGPAFSLGHSPSPPRRRGLPQSPQCCAGSLNPGAGSLPLGVE